MASPQLIDGPADAPACFVLAHGAGAPMDSPFLQSIAAGLARLGWGVVRFEFPYMQRSRDTGKKAAPDRAPVLEACFREQIEALQQRPNLILSGKSMGGRIASHLLASASLSPRVRGGVCLGYPFHPPGKPDALRTDHLINLERPLLVLQGERDSFGKPHEVASYGLPAVVSVEWIPDGDHSFKPRKSSGRSLEQNLDWAITRMDAFARQVSA